jgi:hypothetical protein
MKRTSRICYNVTIIELYNVISSNKFHVTSQIAGFMNELQLWITKTDRGDGAVVQGFLLKCFCPCTRSVSEYLSTRASQGRTVANSAFRQMAVLLVTQEWSFGFDSYSLVGLAFDWRKGQNISPFSRTVHTGPGVLEPLAEWVPASLQGVQLPAWNNHSIPTSAQAKNECSCTSPTPLHLHGVDSHSIISNYMLLIPLACQRSPKNSR